MGLTITRKRIITEARKPGEVFNKLSSAAKRLAVFMSKAYSRSGVRSFSIDDLRSGGFGGWRNIQELFFELESRRFGRVQRHDANTKFHAFVPAMQNITEDIEFDPDEALPDEDRFADPKYIDFAAAILRPADWPHTTFSGDCYDSISDVANKISNSIGAQYTGHQVVNITHDGPWLRSVVPLELREEAEDYDDGEDRVLTYITMDFVWRDGNVPFLGDVLISHFSGVYNNIVIIMHDQPVDITPF